ncbi:hypothetical protein ACP70R_037304 [Stipagrostis hirtigluma subsp. patula]
MKSPPQSSSTAGVGGTLRNHILQLPDDYVGSVEKRKQELWVYERGAMTRRAVTFVPGLYKIFDEILVDAADNKQRDPAMDALLVKIDASEGSISVYSNGGGIPVEFHQEKALYLPEMVFGYLPTSSSGDNVDVVTEGRNCYGLTLANIFSTEFVVEIADGLRMVKYKQVFSENMGKKSDPQITVCEEGENWIKVTFKPDLAKFNMTHLEDDAIALMRKRVVDMAAILGDTVHVGLNGRRVPVTSFSRYMNQYIDSACVDRQRRLPRIFEKVNDQWELGVSLSEGKFQQVSLVNGIATFSGGTHVEYVTNQIATFVTKHLNIKMKNTNVKVHDVKNYLWVFVNVLVDNPSFDSLTKETLVIDEGSFGSECELSDVFLTKVFNCGVVTTRLVRNAGATRPSKGGGTEKQRRIRQSKGLSKHQRAESSSNGG